MADGIVDLMDWPRRVSHDWKNKIFIPTGTHFSITDGRWKSKSRKQVHPSNQNTPVRLARTIFSLGIIICYSGSLQVLKSEKWTRSKALPIVLKVLFLLFVSPSCHMPVSLSWHECEDQTTGINTHTLSYNGNTCTSCNALHVSSPTQYRSAPL